MNNTRERLAENFEKAILQLNGPQRQAVEQIEGPVMVIAGPGTGKTQILAARIGNILQQTDTQANNVLCLTYTEAGTVAMRKRLQQFIGSDAYQVRINTFHAFCNDVIQEHLYLFEKNELEPVSDLEKLEIIKQITVELPKNNILKRYSGNVDYEIKNLMFLYETMKRERWSPEFLTTQIDAYIADLPNREAYRYKRSKKGVYAKGDLKKKDLEEEINRMEKTKAAIRTFPRYQALLAEKGRYDFADMINWVIDAFAAYPDLLATYQEQFQYILVDEFQDTSGSQNELLRYLAGTDDQPNIFVVGDDDQSIFRFQGANVKNMLDFAERYVKHLKTIVLTINYRSVQPILDVSHAVIRHNQERLVNQLPDLEKILTAGHPALKELTLQPRFQSYQNPFTEMAGITYAIESLINDDNIAPEKIAVIYRKNKYGEELSRYLQAKGIPFYIKKKQDVFSDPFIKKLLVILEYVAYETDISYSGDYLLFEILHYDFYQVPPNEIAKIMARIARTKGENKRSLRAYLQDWLATQNPTLFDHPHEAILKTAALIEQRIADAMNKPLTELVETIIRENGFLTAALSSAEKVWYMQLLTSFFDFVKAETRRQPDLTPSGLIRTIRLMQNNGLALMINRSMETENGVHLLTTHGSKGLEYEVVFLAGCEAGNWEKSRNPNNGYKFPDNLMEKSGEDKNHEDERRSFFVALTRAAKQLFISWPETSPEGKPLPPSAFIAEIKDHITLPEDHPVLTDTQLLNFAALNFTEVKPPKMQAVEKQFIDGLLERFSMNVTALNNYLDCPIKFYYNNLVRVPSGKSEATEFGSAVHYALEKFFRSMQDDDNDAFPPADMLLQRFHYYMNRNRQNFTKEAFERRSEQGDLILQDYYDFYINKWNKVISVERRFNNIVVAGIPLKGAMDKLEFNGNLVNVVDYKTGRVDSPLTKEKLKAPNDKNPLGGNYWRQAVFYKILLDHYHQKDWKVVSTEFDFVEPDKNKNYRKIRIDIHPEDTALVMEQIKDSWKKIQRHEFYTGCGKEDCYWCNFTRENHLQAVPEEEEQL